MQGIALAILFLLTLGGCGGHTDEDFGALAGYRSDGFPDRPVFLSSEYDPEGLLAGLSAFWKMEESGGDRADAAGSNHLAETAALGRGDGVIAYGARLEPDRYFTINSNSTLRTGGTDFTVSAWVYLTTTSTTQVYVSKIGEFVVFYSGLRFYFATYNSNRVAEYAAGVNYRIVPKLNTWYHLVGVHDAAAQRNYLYLNGQLVDCVSCMEHAPGDLAFQLGSMAGKYTFAGGMDAVGFWKRRLYDDEILLLYNYGFGREFPFNGILTRPVAVIDGIDEITHNSAVIRGSIVRTDGSNAHLRGFQYGLTTGYGLVASEGGSFYTGPYSLRLDDLLCNTTYHIRALASNAVGVAYGSDQTFTTATCINSISLTNPVPFQVFQRNEDDVADLVVSGRFTRAPDNASSAIEASWNGGPFQTIVAQPEGISFTGILAGQPAGQGTLTVRLAGSPEVFDARDHIGVGDIFIIAGQSNAMGHGDHWQTYTHPYLKASLFGNDDQWKELADPVDSSLNQVDLVSNDSDLPQGSIWPLVATAIMAEQQVPVAFVPAAKGGSRLRYWLPTSNHADPNTLYGSMYRRIQMVGGARAILFWQGESDAQDGVAELSYQDSLIFFAVSAFADFGIKTCVAQIGDFCTSQYCLDQGLDKIRRAQMKAWDEENNILPGPALYDIDLRDENGDGLHFQSDTDILTAATRWWGAMHHNFYGGHSGRGPRVLDAKYNPARTEIFVTFATDFPPLQPSIGISGFTVLLDDQEVPISSATRQADNRLKIRLTAPARGNLTLSFGQGRHGNSANVPKDSSPYTLPSEIFFNLPVTALYQDSDDDGLPDYWLDAHPCLLPADPGADLDGDLASNAEEYNYSDLLDPCYPDSDLDEMPDGWEIINGFDPLWHDSEDDPDLDGLFNLEEYRIGTLPYSSDSDDDLLDDGWEVRLGTDPFIPDEAIDGDADGLSNLDEYIIGTLPGNFDSEGDGMPDGWEVGWDLDPLAADSEADPDGDRLVNGDEYRYQTNPFSVDTDGDTMPDRWELQNGLPPARADAGSDMDHDGLTNLQEYGFGTKPRVRDSDWDGLSDVMETIVRACLDPLFPDSDGDGISDGGPDGEDRDEDGLVDADETDPCLADTDHDGADDAAEAAAGTDPQAWDTDGDGMPDDYEISQSASVPPLDPFLPDGLLDFDGDGIANVHEYWDGSDLRSGNPVGDAGCFFWGEGDGDGVTGPGDIAALNGFLKNLPVNYSMVIPSNSDSQEMDMDLLRGPGDLSILKLIVKSRPVGSMGSRPVALEVVSPAEGLTVGVGDTTRITVRVRNEAGQYTSGLGVVFAVLPSSTGAATLLGGEGASGEDGRYKVTGPIATGSEASIVLRIDAQGAVVIRAYLPACGIPGMGRWSPALQTPEITLTGK